MAMLRIIYYNYTYQYYAAILLVIGLWWVQRFFSRLRLVFYCSLVALVIGCTLSLTHRFFNVVPPPITGYGKLCYWASWLTVTILPALSIDVFYANHPKLVYWTMNFLFETMLFTVFLFALASVGRWTWKVIRNPQRESSQRALRWAKILSVPILLFITPFVLGRYVIFAAEHKAVNSVKRIVVSAQDRTDYYKKYLDSEDANYIENHLCDMGGNFRIANGLFGDRGPGFCSFLVTFESGFTLGGEVKRDDDYQVDIRIPHPLDLYFKNR